MPDAIERLLPRHARVRLELERLLRRLRPGDRLPAQRELAERLGVSREPIRRALRGLAASGAVAVRHGSATRVRRAPRALAGDGAAVLALCVPDVRWPAIARVVAGVAREARARGAAVSIAQDDGDPAVQRAQLAALLRRPHDAVLAFLDRGNATSAEVRALLRRARPGAATVLIDRPVAGARLPCVMTDVAAGMEAVGRHLVALGRRRIAVLSWGDAAGRADSERWAGLRAGLAGGGVAIVRRAEIGYPGDFCAAARAVVAGWIARGRRPAFDAVVAFVDDFALGAHFALRDARVRVPRDVALTGCDDVDAALYAAHGLSLTTVAQPFEDLGAAAARLALAPAAATAGGVQHLLLPPRLVVRASTDAAAKLV